jgi:uncharacterized coiled-coil protein SlyX
MNEFISISDATKIYKVSSNTLRKLVKDNLDSEHIKTVAIKSRHGFKYLISISFLNSLYMLKTGITKDTKNSNTKNSIDTKNSNGSDTKNSNESDTKFINQLQATNNQLCKQVDTQNDIIKNLTTTLQEQQKVVVAQSLQISRLSERTTTEPHVQWNEPSDQGPNNTTKKTTTIELLIVVVLVVCIVAVIIYLFTN